MNWNENVLVSLKQNKRTSRSLYVDFWWCNVVTDGLNLPSECLRDSRYWLGSKYSCVKKPQRGDHSAAEQWAEQEGEAEGNRTWGGNDSIGNICRKLTVGGELLKKLFNKLHKLSIILVKNLFLFSFLLVQFCLRWRPSAVCVSLRFWAGGDGWRWAEL